MMRCNVEPYEGSEPYIFVSYAHRDGSRVFPVIEQLAADGFRIWYDEGIDPGSEWISNIGEHLSNASAVITFLTASSVASQNCREEIMFARSSKTPVLAVHLENVEIDQGLKLALMSYQAVFKYAYEDERQFYRKVEGASMLKACRVAAAFAPSAQYMPTPAPVTQMSQMPPSSQMPPAPQASSMLQMPTVPAGVASKTTSSKGKSIVIIAVAAVVAVILAAVFILGGGAGQKSQPSQSATTSDSTTATTTSTTASSTDDADKPSYMVDVATTSRAFLVGSDGTYDEYIIVRSGNDTGALKSISDITHFYKSAGYTMEEIASFDVESVYPNFNSLSFTTKSIKEKETLAGDGYYEVIYEFNDLKKRENLLALDAAGIITLENKDVDNISGDSVCDLILKHGGKEVDKSEYLERGLPQI